MIYSDNQEADIDPYVDIHSVDKTFADSDDDGGDGLNFSLSFEAKAGVTYVITLSHYITESGSYKYAVDKHIGIIDQPTSVSPTVEISWVEADSYQWFEYNTLEKITSSNASVVEIYGIGSAYIDGEGWSADLWDENGGSFFLIELDSGDAIYLDFGHAIDAETGIWAVNKGEGVYTDSSCYYEDGRLIFVAPYDDVYEIYSYSVGEETRLVAYTAEETLLEGETSAELCNPEIGGIYECQVEVGSETFRSETLFYSYAVTHIPTSDEPHVEVNAGEATYQWSEIVLDDEITDENAEVVDWGNGKSVYTASEGWSGVVDKYGFASYYDFVTVDLVAGQLVTVVVYGNIRDGVGLYSYESEQGEWEFYEKGKTVYHLKVNTDGEYTVYTCPDGDSDVRVRVYLNSMLEEIDGATDNVYYADHDGYYSCLVTMADESEEEYLIYLAAHSHDDIDSDDVCDVCGTEIPKAPTTESGSDTETSGGDAPSGGNSGADDTADGNGGAVVIAVVAAILVAAVAGAVIAYVYVKKRKDQTEDED